MGHWSCWLAPKRSCGQCPVLSVSHLQAKSIPPEYADYPYSCHPAQIFLKRFPVVFVPPPGADYECLNRRPYTCQACSLPTNANHEFHGLHGYGRTLTHGQSIRLPSVKSVQSVVKVPS